jgi:hypothetical protein
MALIIGTDVPLYPLTMENFNRFGRGQPLVLGVVKGFAYTFLEDLTPCFHYDLNEEFYIFVAIVDPSFFGELIREEDRSGLVRNTRIAAQLSCVNGELFLQRVDYNKNPIGRSYKVT